MRLQIQHLQEHAAAAGAAVNAGAAAVAEAEGAAGGNGTAATPDDATAASAATTGAASKAAAALLTATLGSSRMLPVTSVQWKGRLRWVYRLQRRGLLTAVLRQAGLQGAAGATLASP